jgi:hypothetical protein
MRKESLVFVTAVGTAATLVGCSHRHPEPTAGDASAATLSSAPAPSVVPEDPLAMPSASIAAVVNPDGVPPYSGPTGSVEGMVLVKGPDAPDVPDVSAPLCRAALDTYGKLFRAGPARADGLKPLADVVVVVIGYEGRGYYIPERDPAARVTITPSCAYPTRTLAMTFGQWLEVSNDSTQPFGPYLDYVLQGGAIRIAPPRQAGEPVKVYPPRAGHFSMRDRLQPYVREDVWVFRHPLHAVTDLAGHFRIDGVPLGPLKVGAELVALGGTGSKAVAEVDVRENVVQNVEIVLTYEPKPVRAAVTDAGRGGRHLSPND